MDQTRGTDPAVVVWSLFEERRSTLVVVDDQLRRRTVIYRREHLHGGIHTVDSLRHLRIAYRNSAMEFSMVDRWARPANCSDDTERFDQARHLLNV